MLLLAGENVKNVRRKHEIIDHTFTK